MMKSFQIALIAALLLPLGGGALADTRQSAKPAGSSSSYKSGFSSQRSAPASRGERSESRPAPSGAKPTFGSFGSRQPDAAPRPSRRVDADADADAPARARGGFGSFGGARDGGAGAPAKSGSALSKELERNSAKANALRTLDERRAAAAAPAPLPPLNPVLPPNQQPGYQQSQQSQQPSGYNQQQQPYNQPQAPIVVQQGNNGLGSAITGFMLGRAMNSGSNNSGNHGGYYPGANGNANNNGNGGGNGGISANGGGNANINGMPPAEQKSSFGGALLRTFAWLALLGAVGWLIYFGVKMLKRGKARSNANYSFERE